MKKLILLVALCGFFFTNCTKKSDDPAPASTPSTTATLSAKEKLLTQTTWHFTASTADKLVYVLGSETASTNLYSQMSVCASDVEYTYAANKKGTYGGDCGGTMTPQSIGFTWALTSGETVLTITAYGQVNNWTILQLTEDTLVVSYEDTDKNGTAYVRTDTYKKL